MRAVAWSALIFLSSLLVALAYSQVVCPSPSGNQCNTDGFCVSYPSGDSYCACSSGSAGDDCVGAVDASCPFNTVTATTTSNIPLSVRASFEADNLTVSIKSPLVNERAYSTITLDQNAAENPNCTYPGTYWHREFDGCTDKFVGVMPWKETIGCGWTLDTKDQEFLTYETNMLLVHHDFIDPFAGRAGQTPVERLTQHIIPLQVQFPRTVEVATNITVQSPVRLLVAVTRQEVAATTRTAIIDVTTNLLFPYKLTAEQLAAVPSDSYPGMTFSIIEIGSSTFCPNVNGSTCTQIFRINIDIGPNCEISGGYGIDWGLVCQLDPITGLKPSSCAIQPSATSSASISILSEDFCAKVSVKVTITGTLTSFESDAYLTKKTEFLINQTSFFLAKVQSPDATLTSSTIRSVKLVSGEEQILLFSEGRNVIPAAEFQLDQHGEDFAAFYFTLRDSYVIGVAADASRQFSVVAGIDVTFTGVPGVKRLVLQGQLNKKPMSVSSFIGVTAPWIEFPDYTDDNMGLKNRNSAQALSTNFIAVMVCAMAMMII